MVRGNISKSKLKRKSEETNRRWKSWDVEQANRRGNVNLQK